MLVNKNTHALHLHCQKIVETDSGRGPSMHPEYPHPVILQRGENEVDDGFWEEWKKENPDSDLLRNRVVVVKSDKDKSDMDKVDDKLDNNADVNVDPMSPQDAAIAQEGSARDATDAKATPKVPRTPAK
jgi:hypothetical protein